MDSLLLLLTLFVLLIIILAVSSVCYLEVRQSNQYVSEQVLRIEELIGLLKTHTTGKAKDDENTRKSIQIPDAHIIEKKEAKTIRDGIHENNIETFYDEVGGKRYEKEPCEDTGVDSTNELNNEERDLTSVASETRAVDEHKIEGYDPGIERLPCIICDDLVDGREDRQFSACSKEIHTEMHYNFDHNRSLQSTHDYLRFLRVDKGQFNDAIGRFSSTKKDIEQRIRNLTTKAKENRLSRTELKILRKLDRISKPKLLLVEEATILRENIFGEVTTRDTPFDHVNAEKNDVFANSSELTCHIADPKQITTDRDPDTEHVTLVIDVQISNSEDVANNLFIKKGRTFGDKQSFVKMMTDGKRSACLCIPVQSNESLFCIQYGDRNTTYLSEYDRGGELTGSTREIDIRLDQNTVEPYSSLDSGYSSIGSEDSFPSIESDIGEDGDLEEGINFNAFYQGHTTLKTAGWLEKETFVTPRNINRTTISMDQFVADGLGIQIFEMEMGYRVILVIQVGNYNLVSVPKTRVFNFASFEMILKSITPTICHNEISIFSGYIMLELLPSDQLVMRLQSLYSHPQLEGLCKPMDAMTPTTHLDIPWSSIHSLESSNIQIFAKLACPVSEIADFRNIRQTDFRPECADSSALTCNFRSADMDFKPFPVNVIEKQSHEKPTSRSSPCLLTDYANELISTVLKQTKRGELAPCMIKDRFISKQEGWKPNLFEDSTNLTTTNYSNGTITVFTNLSFVVIRRKCIQSKTIYTQKLETENGTRTITLLISSEINQRDMRNDGSTHSAEKLYNQTNSILFMSIRCVTIDEYLVAIEIGSHSDDREIDTNCCIEFNTDAEASLALDRFSCNKLPKRYELYSTNARKGHGQTNIYQLLLNLGLCIRFQAQSCRRETYKRRESMVKDVIEIKPCLGFTVTEAPKFQTQTIKNNRLEKNMNYLVGSDTNTNISKADGINADKCNIETTFESQAACDKYILQAQCIDDNGKNEMADCRVIDCKKLDSLVDSGFFDNDSWEPRETSSSNNPSILQYSPDSDGVFKSIGDDCDDPGDIGSHLKQEKIFQPTATTRFSHHSKTNWTDLVESKDKISSKDPKVTIKGNETGDDEENYMKLGIMSLNRDGNHADIIDKNYEKAKKRDTEQSQNYQKGNTAINICLNNVRVENIRDTYAEGYEDQRKGRDNQHMSIQTQLDRDSYMKRKMHKGLKRGEEINHKGTKYSRPRIYPTKVSIQRSLCENLAFTKTDDHFDIFQFLHMSDVQFVGNGIICKTSQKGETINKLSRFYREITKYFYYSLSPFEIYPGAFIQNENDIELRIRAM